MRSLGKRVGGKTSREFESRRLRQIKFSSKKIYRMIAASNKSRIEQEIANLITFISDGRSFFFAQTGLSSESSDDWFDHFKTKELFQEHLELRQLELNIQLFYIKLSSYYQLIADKKGRDAVNKQRQAFAHELTDIIFSDRVKYNFFLHKVTENFKRIEFIFYEEDERKLIEQGSILSETLDMDLDKDINDFISAWTIARGQDGDDAQIKPQ